MAMTTETDAPTDPMRAGFDQEKYSDVVIKYGNGNSDRSIFAHNIILCRESEYFRKMFDKFQESSQNEITLHDDDPDAATAMLQYLYGLYSKNGDESIPAESILLPTVRVYIVADKYSLHDLREVALEKLRVMLDYYTLDDLISAGFYEAMHLAFSDTHGGDSGIRPLFRKCCAKNIQTLREHPEFKSSLLETPELAAALVLEGVEGLGVKDVGIWECIDCGFKYVRNPGELRQVECLCGNDVNDPEKGFDSWYVDGAGFVY